MQDQTENIAETTQTEDVSDPSLKIENASEPVPDAQIDAVEPAANAVVDPCAAACTPNGEPLDEDEPLVVTPAMAFDSLEFVYAYAREDPALQCVVGTLNRACMLWPKELRGDSDPAETG